MLCVYYVGISVGLMGSIDVGSNDRWEHFLIGEPLARVAVAESKAEKGDLVICPDTHAIIHGHGLINPVLHFHEPHIDSPAHATHHNNTAVAGAAGGGGSGGDGNPNKKPKKRLSIMALNPFAKHDTAAQAPPAHLPEIAPSHGSSHSHSSAGSSKPGAAHGTAHGVQHHHHIEHHHTHVVPPSCGCSQLDNGYWKLCKHVTPKSTQNASKPSRTKQKLENSMRMDGSLIREVTILLSAIGSVTCVL